MRSFSIQEGGPPLTDDMILGHKLYKKAIETVRSVLYGGGEAELGSGSLVVFVIFLFTLP